MFTAIAFLSMLFFVYKRTLFYSLFFQQERYSTKSFTKFILNKFQLIDKKLSLILFFYTIFATGTKIYNLDMSVISILFLTFAILTPNPRSGFAKKQLDITKRLKRILEVAFVLDVFFTGLLLSYMYKLNSKNIYCFCEVMGYMILFIQSLPFMLIISNIILSPVEIFVKHRYVAEAKSILENYRPIVIGITGSFGKTSTKNILNHILSSVAPSMTTARSINTLMGITQVIREDLKPSYKYFIVEVGTSKKGRIKKICNLIKPQYGILTAIGSAHFESFKSKDAIAKEKFDLIKSVKNNNGSYIINSALVEDKYIQKYHADRTDFSVSDVTVSAMGIKFKLNYNKQKYIISAPVFGEHQAQNISLAFIMALKLGIPSDTVIAALKTLPQTEHRLEVKAQGDLTIIDDAFNSNIDGFKSALSTLNIIAKENKGRAILITPGMVELGKKHDEQHTEVAKIAIKTCDIVIAVVPDRIKSFVDTFTAGKNDKQEIILVNTLAEARQWLSLNAKKHDVILYENDLPDVFEAKIRI
ncbi:MAG: UDP-N-acetylmuramoyl-tripeptide--D-alanyl-D-alanine ligase [Alphaproteobacteria bacterium]|nr:UDP-N-acetylmuramoyl-tripeptide--D-alanyl-D-alanine ligase [Alphaproteobacteria bacterium]